MSDHEVALEANMSAANIKQSGRNQHVTPRFAYKKDL